jgi:hypothetical protein
MSFKSLLWSVALLVLGCALPSSAASSGTSKPKPPEPTGNRYLFIVENSSAMQKRDESTRQTIFEFINTGLRGRMLPGDTFGVWAFNSQPETRFPMQVWDSATRLDLATRVNLFLKDLGYTKRSNFERVWRDLQAVVASVNELTVVLITDGKNKISGTPFDQEINTTYRQLGGELTTKNQPFITAFVLREGHFAAYSVTQPGESLILPPPSEKARVRPSSLARSRQDLDDEESSKPAVTPAPPRRVPSIIVTRESVARENDPIGPNHSSSPSAPAPSTPAAASPAPPSVTGPSPVSPAPTAGVSATTPAISKSSLPSTASAGPLTAISPPTTAVSQAVSLPSTATAASAAATVPPTAPTGSPVPQPAPSAPAQPVSNDAAPATAPASVPAPTASIESIAPIAPALTPTPAAPAASKPPAATALPIATQAARPASVDVQTPPLPTPPTAPAAHPSPAVVAAAIANLPPSSRPQPTAAAGATSQASASSTKSTPTASMVVHARQPTASALAASASAPTVAAAPFKSTEGPGARSRTKLILASVMLVGAMGCFWVHQQRARRARQSSFISRALPRTSAAAPQPKR